MLSDWLGDPSFCRMTSLNISECENCYCSPAIGQLPSLGYLNIDGLSKILVIGEEFYGKEKPFPCLKKFMIANMSEWREWHVSVNGGFSCLEGLRIWFCPKLIGEIPKQLPSLRTLEIWRYPGLVNADGGLNIFDSKVESPVKLCALRYLGIEEMPDLKELSSSSDLNQLLPSLEQLNIKECQHIVQLSINSFPTTLE